MAIAFDAITFSSASTGDITFTHTPVGTPRAVNVFVWQQTQTTDQVLGVSYGAAGLTRVPTHGFKQVTSQGALYGYTLGASIPTGAQTVFVDYSGLVGNCWGICVTFTAASDVQINSANSISNVSLDDPSTTIPTLAGYSGMASVMFASGLDNTTDTTVGSGYTMSQLDLGARTLCYERGTKSGANVVADFTTTAADFVGVIALALEEIVAAGSPGGGLMMLGS